MGTSWNTKNGCLKFGDFQPLNLMNPYETSAKHPTILDATVGPPKCQSSRDAAALWAYDLVMREVMGWDGAKQVIP